MIDSRALEGVIEDAGAPLLQASGVRKAFGKTRALKQADVQIHAGEIVAVMGPSGSGKSTLLHCLAGILVPDEGAVVYDGRRVDRLDEEQRSALRRTDFGFVFQFGQLLGELTVLENVALPLLLNGVKRGEAMARAGQWLETFGLIELGRRRPHEVSGGQAQRTAIARAMATSPKVIFADEPTGSLDSAAGLLVLDSFTSVAQSHGVAIVLVTHESRVAAYATRTIVVRDGVVATPTAVEPSR
ncbi:MULTISPECIES: ABC transporter ATP-binding protein [Micromonospora]|uniref:Putative ABC transport system ATP-binding protein n=1 Tax=Micromonospora yangpuensis TaxID=683228 RepID=A0A1C6UMM3_9ACTN|nr:ABC transporter ATP-binding protein [Micromonospora yangpuensis]GGM27852.1 ABC transporter ATP-binding protein [Micromonospora yangpuensis]SCL55218.1 putative ABC transport system ATP-binding protein [Micromonospora yangpuensis]